MILCSFIHFSFFCYYFSHLLSVRNFDNQQTGTRKEKIESDARHFLAIIALIFCQTVPLFHHSVCNSFLYFKGRFVIYSVSCSSAGAITGHSPSSSSLLLPGAMKKKKKYGGGYYIICRRCASLFFSRSFHCVCLLLQYLSTDSIVNVRAAGKS